MKEDNEAMLSAYLESAATLGELRRFIDVLDTAQVFDDEAEVDLSSPGEIYVHQKFDI